MGKSFEALREDIRTMRLEGKSPQEMRRHFTAMGWELAAVDRELWQLKLRDRKNTHFTSRAKRGGLAVIIILGFVGIVAGTLSYEKYQKSKEQGVAGAASTQDTQKDETAPAEPVLLRGEPIVSEGAGIRFDYPSDWTVTASEPEETGGAFQWQLEHIENKPIKDALVEKYDIETEDSDDASVAQLALVSDPLVEKLTTVTITVYKAPDYDIESSLTEWRSQIDQANGKIGFWAENFKDVEFSGVPGYNYTTRVTFGQLDISTADFVLLDAPDRRVEISIFPLKTSHAAAIDAILLSIEL